MQIDAKSEVICAEDYYITWKEIGTAMGGLTPSAVRMRYQRSLETDDKMPVEFDPRPMAHRGRLLAWWARHIIALRRF